MITHLRIEALGALALFGCGTIHAAAQDTTRFKYLGTTEFFQAIRQHEAEIAAAEPKTFADYVAANNSTKPSVYVVKSEFDGHKVMRLGLIIGYSESVSETSIKEKFIYQYGTLPLFTHYIKKNDGEKVWNPESPFASQN